MYRGGVGGGWGPGDAGGGGGGGLHYLGYFQNFVVFGSNVYNRDKVYMHQNFLKVDVHDNR